MASIIAPHLVHSKTANRVKGRLGQEVSPSGVGTFVQHCQVRLWVLITRRSKVRVTLFNSEAKNTRLLKPWSQIKERKFNPNERG
jgi:hypothetical protein